MNWLKRLFSKEERDFHSSSPTGGISSAPLNPVWNIPFGKYSDNNKPFSKIQNWYESESNFEKDQYALSFQLFFDHLRDDLVENVTFTKGEDSTFSFEIIQGSARVQGSSDGADIMARATLASMQKPSIAAMNRLLQRNFDLRYVRFAIDEKESFCLLFETPVSLASPSRLYFGLRELALNADQYDDELIGDFANLQRSQIYIPDLVPESEIKAKYKYFRKWISEAVESVSGLNADSFSGAIAYILLTTLYRIEYLIAPEGALQKRLDELGDLYWKRKEDLPLVSRNARIGEGLRSLLDISEEEFRKSLIRSKKTFSAMSPPPKQKIAEHIRNANRDAEWYIANEYPKIALEIVEYGIVYSQYCYSVPAIITQLSTLFLAVLHSDFFRDLGHDPDLLRPETGNPDPRRVIASINAILSRWSDKYPRLYWDQSRIVFDSMWDFARTFTEQLANLNLEIRR